MTRMEAAVAVVAIFYRGRPEGTDFTLDEASCYHGALAYLRSEFIAGKEQRADEPLAEEVWTNEDALAATPPPEVTKDLPSWGPVKLVRFH